MNGWKWYGTFAIAVATACAVVGWTVAALSFGLSSLAALYLSDGR